MLHLVTRCSATMAVEWAAPLLLLAYHYRDTRTRPAAGRSQPAGFRAGLQARVVFHVGTHLTMRLGIFPFAVLALYPAALHPDEWGALLVRVRRRLPRWSGSTAP